MQSCSVDFAETIQQATHWNQSQITIFSTVVLVKEKVQLYVVISDGFHHNKKAVATFLSGIVKGVLWLRIYHLTITKTQCGPDHY